MVVGAILSGLLLSTAFAQTPRSNDYSDPKSWLCRPAGHDACDVDLTTTVIMADGQLSRETWTADPNAPIDCFYVYPTVSTDTTPNSDMTADAAELNVIRQQFARFASKCRPYAPLYRQVTLAGLRSRLAGGGGSLARGLQYDDVKDAWNYYLEHDNKGRGVVVIGHSQGSFILARLIREQIDGQPVQSRRKFGLVRQPEGGKEQRRDDGWVGQALSLFKARYLGLAVANGESEFALSQPGAVPEDAQHPAEIRYR